MQQLSARVDSVNDRDEMFVELTSRDRVDQLALRILQAAILDLGPGIDGLSWSVSAVPPNILAAAADLVAAPEDVFGVGPVGSETSRGGYRRADPSLESRTAIAR